MESMGSSITYSRVTVSDLPELQALAKQVFVESFISGNSEENMNAYLDAAFSDEKLTQELENTQSQFYFAKMDDKLIGYFKINTRDAQTEMKNEPWAEIERIYVIKECQGKGVGQFMMDEILSICRKMKVKCIWLGVWEMNKGAIKFYQRNGFAQFDSHVFYVGDDPQTDWMMKRELS
jgi:ribosomal protein S18 acetylase RimI-like enzyme